METQPFYNLALTLDDWEEILHALRLHAYDLGDRASQFDSDSRYRAILYHEAQRASAIADELEAILPEPEDAT